MSKSRRDLLYSRTKKIPDNLTCTICLDIIYDPKQLKCKHSFCADCIINWIKNSKECPLCRHKIMAGYPIEDKNMGIQLEELSVFCKYLNCPWTGPQKNVIEHEKNCSFSPDKSNEKILSKLPIYAKDENSTDTPCVSLITNIFKDYPNLAIRLLFDEEKPIKKIKNKIPKKSYDQKTIVAFITKKSTTSTI